MHSGRRQLTLFRQGAAEADLLRALAGFSAPHHGSRRIDAHCLLADIALEREDRESAQTHLEACGDDLPGRPPQWQARVDLGWGHLLLKQGDMRPAAERLEQALAVFRELAMPADLAHGQRLAARFLLEHGLPGEGWKRLQDALDALEGVPGLEAERARCLMDQGALARRWGKKELAAAALDQALALFRRLEAPEAAAQVAQARFELVEDQRAGGPAQDRDQARQALEEAVQAFRCGLETRGGEALARLIDGAMANLAGHGWAANPERVNPLLTRILAAQQRGDLIGMADDLELALAPLWLP
ncbi:MAG: hypothetical protein HQL82_16600 [Magnetococcales bacterium]|nr:hypothetical protein [Magnetococcales bacterium]